MNRMNQILAPAATLSCQPGEQLPQESLAFGCLNLGDIHMKEADRVALEALPLRLVALNVRQTEYAVPLQAAVQR